MNIRIANNNEIDLLLEMRLEFIHDIHPEYDIQKINLIKNGSREYIQEHIQKNMYMGPLKTTPQKSKTMVKFKA